MKNLAVLVIATAFAAPAYAQDVPIDQSKLYLGSPEACAAAEGGAMTEGDFTNLRFADSAVQFSEEAWCTFYDVKSAEGRADLIATALCEFGGNKFIDTFLISPIDEKTIQLQSQKELVANEIYNATTEISAESPMAESLPTTFTRCELDDFPRP